MINPALSIIIVSFNTREILKQCLENLPLGLRGFTPPLPSELILVDNRSQDGSVELIKDVKGKLKNDKLNIGLILNKKNLGFAKAVNQGIRKSRGEYLLLFNSDIICQSGSITKLIKFAQERKYLGLVGGKLLNPDGSGQASVFHLPTLQGAIAEFWLGKEGSFQKYLPSAKKPIEVEAIVGAVMLIPRKTIRQTGIFDESFFMYFEDLDYCRRLREKGFKIFYQPQAVFIHLHGISGKRNPQAASRYLVKSSKIYYGIWRHYLINLVIWTGQIWQKFLSKI